MQAFLKDKDKSIRLLYPNLDFSYTYPSLNPEGQAAVDKHGAFLDAKFKSPKFESLHEEVGSLAPHILLGEHGSLRQLIAHGKG